MIADVNEFNERKQNEMGCAQTPKHINHLIEYALHALNQLRSNEPTCYITYSIRVSN